MLPFLTKEQLSFMDNVVFCGRPQRLITCCRLSCLLPTADVEVAMKGCGLPELQEAV